MWIEEFSLENVRCFEKISLRFGTKSQAYPWITLLSENGNGKSTILQAIAVMLAGPESSAQLLPRPIGWVKKDGQPGKLSIRIHKDTTDSGVYGIEKQRNSFGYSMHVTGSEKTLIRNKTYSEPGFHESPDKILSWLRQNAFSSGNYGWFGVGYGAFRRLTRTSQIIVPSLQPPARATNFITQFKEDEGLASFERWVIFLDYQQAKTKDASAKKMLQMGIEAINALLPDNVKFSSIDANGFIFFSVNGSQVPTVALSDGYRSVLALAGDLVWRMIVAFPDSSNPLHERGVVLIDELDIHLHPSWQRQISSWLRKQFPNLQFIVTTHSPFIAAGAGQDAVTYKISLDGGARDVSINNDLFAMDVDDVLKSDAFGLLSTFAPATQEKLDRYEALRRRKAPLPSGELAELKQLSLFVDKHNPYGISKLDPILEDRISSFVSNLGKKL